MDFPRKLEADKGLFPTIFPVPAQAVGRTSRLPIPPHPAARPALDGFAICEPDGRKSTAAELQVPMPFPPEGHPLDAAHCGHARLYDIGGLARAFGFMPGSLYVLDMSTYHWSSTLKDPRSWAVVRTAASAGIKHLGVWTAGNAGLSLAKIAYAFNRTMSPRRRITVHCYTIGHSVPRELEVNLQRFDAHVSNFADPFEGKIFPPSLALKRLNARLGRAHRIRTNEYWEVTDGWDGVGLYMYRLLGRQICAHVRPDYIVVPLGTGDLFYGLYLGRQDCVDADVIKKNMCHFIAARPSKNSIKDNYDHYKMMLPASPLESDVAEALASPLAPKLEANYTPLLLVMYRALRDSCVDVVPVGMSGQRTAAQLILSEQPDYFVATEPSSLLAFGALPYLRKRLSEDARSAARYTVRDRRTKAVVVNSGCGALSAEELAYLGEWLPKVKPV